MSRIIQLGAHGPVFKLYPGHSLDSVRADAKRSERDPALKPWLCRRGLHTRQTIGEPYVPPIETDDMYGTILALIANRNYVDLVRCPRCGSTAPRHQ